MQTETTIPTMSAEAAADAGFHPITTAYGPTTYQQDLMSRALAQLDGCKIAAVQVAAGTEIWRHRSQVTLTTNA